jgi:hypothetical protein
MKTKIIALCLFLASIPVFAASPQDDPYTRSIPVDDFKKIYVEGGYRVFLYQTDTPFLRIKAPTDNHIDALNIKTDQENLKLSVVRQQLNLSRMELHIGFRKLEELHISGGVKLTTEGYLSLDNLRIYIEGAISGEMKATAKTIEVISNGGSMFDLSGLTGRLTVNVAGAGHINAREMKAKEVVFRVEGLGFGSVYATEELDVRIEGVGKVTYQGKPNVKRVVEGLGSVSEY